MLVQFSAERNLKTCSYKTIKMMHAYYLRIGRRGRPVLTNGKRPEDKKERRNTHDIPKVRLPLKDAAKREQILP